uniref:Protein CRT10 n=1 Tax=Anthurium amnicola TaxID=1678845 RepID=A0A1D1ZE78_9ARAE
MKKARRPPMEASPAPPAYPLPAVGDDSRARYKLQSLMQDYEDLLKDMAAKRRRLRMGRQKQLRLTDEVRFLRRRYKYLTKNASPPTYKVKTQPQKNMNGPKHKARKPPATLNTQPHGQEQLFLHERSHRKKEVAMPSTSAILDLNQISLPNGEEEFQLAWEPLPIERSSRRYLSEGDVPGGDLKLSVCRDVQSGSSRPGKRKISWQDQLALKV